MALARVVEFEGVSSDRLNEMRQRMESGQPPEGMPSSELVALHDPQTETSLVILMLESEEDYNKADEILSAMPAGETPGQRSSVKKYNVAMRMSN
jgi:hypothetical protein